MESKVENTVESTVESTVENTTENAELQPESKPTSKLKSTHRMSARQLVISENAELQFVKNPKTGKTFFVCGSKRGYVSPNVVKIMNTCTLDDLQYAEVSANGGVAVPCLMVVGNSEANVQRKLGTDLLH